MASVGLGQLVGYFLRLGSLGFGGPIALAGYMQRDLVTRKWITEEEYAEGLAFAQMMPEPLAAQLAMWIGFIRHGCLNLWSSRVQLLRACCCTESEGPGDFW